MSLNKDFSSSGRYLDRFEAAKISGAIVVIDVLRAFTTAAYAFAGGVEKIVLVDSVVEALALKQKNPEWLAMGEDNGNRVKDFDFTNSPVEIAKATICGRTLIQRTTAGTRGVVACESADRVWASGLVTASATAKAVQRSGLGQPHYVVTGSWPGRHLSGNDDWWTAQLIERVRTSMPRDSVETCDLIRSSPEADFTLSLGDGNVDPSDVEFSLKVDLFDFAMEAQKESEQWVLRAVTQD